MFLIASQKLPQEKSDHTAVVEICITQSQESKFVTVCDINLNLCSAAELIGSTSSTM